MFMGLVVLFGCQSRRPANVRHISFRIFEIIDCKTSGITAVSLKGSAEKYCLAATPVIDETDIKAAQALRSESGKARVEMFFSLKTGERMKEVTGRIYTEHLQRKEQGRLGIVMDGTLVIVAPLSEVISDELVIDGNFSWEDAVQIAQSLNRAR
jgi:preprotein translocase subunit SecD